MPDQQQHLCTHIHRFCPHLVAEIAELGLVQLVHVNVLPVVFPFAHPPGLAQSLLKAHGCRAITDDVIELLQVRVAEHGAAALGGIAAGGQAGRKLRGLSLQQIPLTSVCRAVGI